MTKRKEVKLKAGRHTIYTEELADKICRALENSARGLAFLCEHNEDFPAAETVREWLRKNTFPVFSVKYARARASQADFLSDELIDVTYDAEPDKFGRVEKQKLMAEAIKWKAKVLKPKIYGDNVDKYLTETEEETAITKHSLTERIAKLVGLARNKKDTSVSE